MAWNYEEAKYDIWDEHIAIVTLIQYPLEKIYDKNIYNLAVSSKNTTFIQNEGFVLLDYVSFHLSRS